MRGRGVIVPAMFASAGLVAGCGGGGQRAAESHGEYSVAVTATFPARQRLAEQTSLLVRIRNVGRRAVPDVAVTVLNPRYGTAAQSFGTLISTSSPGQPPLATRSRPVWIVDRAPGPCRYSCRSRGPGGAATADSNTWALGRLPPGHTVVFRWTLTAVKAGSYPVEYEVASGVTGDGVAVLPGRRPARGRFRIRISAVPLAVTVASDGRVMPQRPPSRPAGPTSRS